MSGAHELLKALATVLCVAAVTTVVFQRLRQPVVLGYLIAGLIIGPHVPVPLVADPEIVETLSELGVILLMFSVGLELRLGKLLERGATAGLTAIIQCSLMVWLGFMTGRLFGWTPMESVFTGAIIAISSTTIIAKAFDEQGVKGTLREIVVGILVVEDLIAILLLATLTAVGSGSRLSAGALAMTIGRLGGFLIGLLVVGLITVPRAVRAIARLQRPETMLIASVGICFGIALLAQAFGYSVALGAFIAGSLVAESGQEQAIAHLIEPVRDMFAAVFFVSVGMMIDPILIAHHWLAIAVLTVVVVAGKVASVTLGTFLTGSGVRTSVQAGMSLAQIGEFSFIIAGLGLSLHATREFLYPVAVSVSALTTLLTPWLIRAAGPTADRIDRRLPPALQTFVALYGSWIEALRRPGAGALTTIARVRRLIRLLVLDAALLAGIIVGASLALETVAAFVAATIHIGQPVARLVVAGAAAALSVPFSVGIVRVARQLGVTLAAMALPARRAAPGETQVDAAAPIDLAEAASIDLAAAPRKALAVTLQIAGMLLVGAPVLAVTQPFLPGLNEAAVFLALLAGLGIVFWRSAASLQGHVRAGAQIVVEALAAQLRAGTPSPAPTGTPTPTPAETPGETLDGELDRLLPGLGAPVAVTLGPASPAVGKTLAQLNLRALSGATILVVVRGEKGLLPTADQGLTAGDILALAGTQEALAAARRLLNGPP